MDAQTQGRASNLVPKEKGSESIGHDNGGRGNDHLHAEMQREELALRGWSLTPGDLERAQGAIICFSQKERFPDEIAVLGDGGSFKQDSNLYKLDPVLQDRLLREAILECVVCRRLQGKTGEQKMANLPVERIVPDLPAFTNVGVDYFGPVEVKKGRGTVKCYGVLFTCMASQPINPQCHIYPEEMIQTGNLCHQWHEQHHQGAEDTHLLCSWLQLRSSDRQARLVNKSKDVMDCSGDNFAIVFAAMGLPHADMTFKLTYLKPALFIENISKYGIRSLQHLASQTSQPDNYQTTCECPEKPSKDTAIDQLSAQNRQPGAKFLPKTMGHFGPSAENYQCFPYYVFSSGAAPLLENQRHCKNLHMIGI
ncbi:V-type proton ATPase subunit B [Merluccius polli]|uniref:V-type proton ATPase subunit B n=1 Tax=Merluccius polli TaxID=89951 RepID=A0AA47MJQ1_MERPO|nr:V-type proton ATPase subunit B [Merluccius polli]